MKRLFPPEARPALLVAAMTASVVLFVFAAMAVRMAWLGSATERIRPAEAPSVDPAVLRASWIDGILGAHARLGALPNKAQRDAVEADILNLRVPTEYRDLHLRIVLGLRNWDVDGGTSFEASVVEAVGP
jgi:hypothetical protein